MRQVAGTAVLSATQDAEDLADRFTHLSFTLGDALLALAVIIVAWLLSRLTRRAVTKAAARVRGVSDDLRSLGARLSGYLVLFVGIGVALGFLGVQIQPVLAVVILIGVVIVLALRGIANNFAAGIVIQTRQPVRLGDEVDALGYVGVVKELNSRVVVIVTHDGRTVHLPNHKLLDAPIVNHSTTGNRRSEIEVRVLGDDSADLAQLLEETVAATHGVRAKPRPTVSVAAAETDRTIFNVRFWHAPAEEVAVTSETVTELGQRLRDAGVTSTVTARPPDAPLPPPPRA